MAFYEVHIYTLLLYEDVFPTACILNFLNQDSWIYELTLLLNLLEVYLERGFVYM